MILAMLEDKDALWLQQSFLEDEAWDRGELFQCVWWIGKDKVELLFARLDEAESIGAKRYTGLCIQLPQTVLDEAVMVFVGLDADHLTAAA